MKTFVAKFFVVLIALLTVFAVYKASAQLNYSGKAYQSINADSATVRGYLTADSTAGRFTGWIYYNKQSKKWRAGWIDSDTTIQWTDAFTPGGGAMDSLYAYNGLTRVGNDSVKLGGTLTENTSISGDAFAFDLTYSNVDAFALNGNAITLTTVDDFSIIAGLSSLTFDAGVSDDATLTGEDDAIIIGTDEAVLKNPTSNSVRVQTTGVAIAASDPGDDVNIDAANGVNINTGNVGINFDGGKATLTADATPTFTLNLSTTDRIRETGGAIYVEGNGPTFDETIHLDTQSGTPYIALSNSGASAPGFTLDATGLIAVNATNYTLSNSGGDVTISTIATGGDDIFITSRDDIALSVAAGGIPFSITSSDGSNLAMSSGSVLQLQEPSGGSATVNLVSTGNGTMTLTSAAGNRVITTNNGLLIQNLTAGNVTITSPDDFTLTAGGDDLIATAADAIDFSSTGVSNYTSAGNMNITATTSDDVNVTASDDINLVAEGGDIIGSAAGNFHALATGDVFLSPGSGAGNDLRIVSGANRSMGTAVLVGGTVTVNNTKVTASSNIFLTSQVDGGTPGFVRISARSAGTSFTITSSSGTDTSTIAWLIIEP